MAIVEVRATGWGDLSIGNGHSYGSKPNRIEADAEIGLQN